MLNKTIPQSAIAATVVTGSLLMSSAPTMAAAIGVDWTTPTTGDLDGTSVTLSNINIPNFFTTDLSGSDYSAAPLSTSQQTVAYDQNSDWTTTFSSSVSNLLLYGVFWRGGNTITFDQSFTIASGFAGATVAGNSITLPGSVNTFSNGIIEFTGPVSSLSADSSIPPGRASQIGLTFGINERNGTVPEPLTILGAGAAIAFGATFKGKLKKAQKK